MNLILEIIGEGCTRLCLGSALLFMVLVSTAVAQKPRCKDITLQKPESYEKESESYYLSWIQHGKPGQRAIAALTLLETKNKSQYDLTQKLWKCESNIVVKNALLFALFDQRADANIKAVEEILSEERYDLSLGMTFPAGESIKLQGLETGNPPPFAEYLAKGYVDYYFDWGQTAALRLIKGGYLSDRAFDVILRLASSPTIYAKRKDASEVFDLFDQVPEYDPAPREHLDDLPGALPDPIPAGLEKYVAGRQKQVKAIKDWYKENKRRLKWNKDKGRYVLGG